MYVCALIAGSSVVEVFRSGEMKGKREWSDKLEAEHRKTTPITVTLTTSKFFLYALYRERDLLSQF
jgi:hypothetical protein